MELANRIWEMHIDNYNHFDLVCHNSTSLEEETKTIALFSTLITLKEMLNTEKRPDKVIELLDSIEYLKNSNYYIS